MKKCFFVFALVFVAIIAVSAFSSAASSTEMYNHYEYDPVTGEEKVVSVPALSMSAYARSSNESVEYDLQGNIISRSTPPFDPYADNNISMKLASKFTPLARTQNADDYTQVTNTSAFPYRCIGYIRVVKGVDSNGNEVATYGSASLQGPALLLTAGHLCHFTDYGWADEIKFYPGAYSTEQQGNLVTPYGCHQMKSITIPSEWRVDRNYNYDWGVVVLKTSPGVGNLGKRVVSSSYLNSTVIMTGYPYTTETPDWTFYMYTSSGRINVMTDYRLYCSYKGYSRASGAPVYDSGNYVMGIHSQSDSTYCYATRMTQRLYNILQTKLEEYNAGS